MERERRRGRGGGVVTEVMLSSFIGCQLTP